MEWPRIFVSITGTVDQELLLRNEYLATENRILKDQVKRRVLLSDPQKKTLAEIGYWLGRTALVDVAHAAKPETILGWYRTLVVQKFDGFQVRRHVGRLHISHEVEQLILRMAKENRDWGYDRIAGAVANLGHPVSDQTIGNML
jgi:putative transposase